mmetsp:Transcript_8730/g.13458  ORF Transcript_8730/g.13458 Transcript_8730/m.13458 type:complete len:170 (-) Transcript_8730:203-712(-)
MKFFSRGKKSPPPPQDEDDFVLLDSDGKEGETENENETKEDPSVLENFTDSASQVVHGGADQIKGWNEQHRILERINESIKNVGDAMKKWDEQHGFAEKFNKLFESSGKQLQEWDQKSQVRVKSLRFASSGLASLSKTFDPSELETKEETKAEPTPNAALESNKEQNTK